MAAWTMAGGCGERLPLSRPDAMPHVSANSPDADRSDAEVPVPDALPNAGDAMRSASDAPLGNPDAAPIAPDASPKPTWDAAVPPPDGGPPDAMVPDAMVPDAMVPDAMVPDAMTVAAMDAMVPVSDAAAPLDADISSPDAAPSGALIFDHRHTALDAIPSTCINAVKAGTFVFHYAHRSHGSQIIVGARSIEADLPTFGFASSYCSVPSESGVLRMWDGMISTNLVQPEGYWAAEAGLDDLRGILNANPELRYSMWAWSFEISEQSEAEVQQYLNTMAALEVEFPEVTFIYMTGPAQGTYNAVNRYDRNRQIREYCQENGKVLFDFEDLEAWWNGDHHTEVVDGVTLPMEHPHYSLDTPGNTEYQWTHTTQDSCENKARAFWWMMAKLEGCSL